MKKGGFALFVYAFYTIACLGWIAYTRFVVVGETFEGWEGLGYALLLILALVVLVPSVVGLILKLIHRASGWAFMGVLCILVDLSFITTIIYSVVESGDFASIPVMLIPMAISVGALISNIKSLRRY